MSLTNSKSLLRTIAYASFGVLSAAIIVSAHRHLLAFSEAEAWGFVTGGWGVWLTVEKSIWTWPVGLANNVFFFVLFLRAKLFADMAPQIVYIILGVLGWYWCSLAVSEGRSCRSRLLPRQWSSMLQARL